MMGTIRSQHDEDRRIVVFADLRGFTQISEDVRNYSTIPRFLYEWHSDMQILAKLHSLDRYGEIVYRPLGDGVMLVVQGFKQSYPVLDKILGFILDVETNFTKRCQSVNHQYASAYEESIGWGITRGVVFPVQGNDGPFRPCMRELHPELLPKDALIDFAGACINRAKRLCDIARPSGVVIDASDFKTIPQREFFEFRNEVAKGLYGISRDVDIWRCEIDVDGAIARRMHEDYFGSSESTRTREE